MNGDIHTARNTKVCFADSPKTEMIEMDSPPRIQMGNTLLADEQTQPTVV